MIDNTDFETFVLDQMRSHYDPDRFPIIYQDEGGDCVEAFCSDEPFNGERVDGRITVYRGRNSNEVVGAQIKGIKTWIARILATYPGFHLDIVDSGNEILGILFHIEQLTARDVKLQMQYRELRKVGAKWRIETKNLKPELLAAVV